MTSYFKYTALALAALLASCATPMVGPDYRAPKVSVPSGWSAQDVTQTATTVQPQPHAHWWKQLQDQQLDQLIEQAIANNLSLKLAQARLQQARASRGVSSSGLLPTVSASAGTSRSNSSDVVSSLPERSLYDAGFDARWEIDVFGATRRGVEAADADVAASQANLNNVRVSLVAEVARNYVELRANQQRITIARENLASQSETLQITEWRYQSGLARASEVDQARTAREQTRAGIPDLEVSLTAAENRIAVLLGLHPGDLHSQLAQVKSLPAIPDSVATGIPADVLLNRPDLIAAERTLAAETARVGQKMAQRYPSLTLTGSFGWQAYSFAALGGADTIARSLAGTLAATLFDGGRLRGLVQVQSAVQEQALISYQASVLSALEEVENALKGYAAAHERVQARRSAAESAQNAAELTRKLYQSGLADFQQVLETQRTQLSTQDSLASADASLRTNLITLYKALGGGWDAPTSEKKS
ncbi:efflux transporter outer membrane subunit [Limnohabitans sp.]|uniref:efflux transporter outer membrane subunit n=1 Tax=Limnohabitans sp. TaxID=1907725 RepID=UPI0035B24224